MFFVDRTHPYLFGFLRLSDGVQYINNACILLCRLPSRLPSRAHIFETFESLPQSMLLSDCEQAIGVILVLVKMMKPNKKSATALL